VGAELKALAGAGKLLPTDLVWKEGLATWRLACEVNGLFETVPSRPIIRVPERARSKKRANRGLSGQQRTGLLVAVAGLLIAIVVGVNLLQGSGEQSGSSASWFSFGKLSAAEAKERLLEISRKHDGAFAACTRSVVKCVESGNWPLSMGDGQMREYVAKGTITQETYAAYEVWRKAYLAEKK
jgi:hypothetical protein